MIQFSLLILLMVILVNLSLQDRNIHLLEVKESYFRHMRVALVAAVLAAVAVPVLVVHSVVPSLFKKFGRELLKGACGVSKR
jgi:hypothetical protein